MGQMQPKHVNMLNKKGTGEGNYSRQENWNKNNNTNINRGNTGNGNMDKQIRTTAARIANTV